MKITMGSIILRAEFVEKRCDEDGQWEGRTGNPRERDSPSGWTNYTSCFTPEMLLLIRKLYTGSEDLAKVHIHTTHVTTFLIRKPNFNHTQIIQFSMSIIFIEEVK
jgi:hypothetical protein